MSKKINKFQHYVSYNYINVFEIPNGMLLELGSGISRFLCIWHDNPHLPCSNAKKNTYKVHDAYIESANQCTVIAL